MRLEAVLLISSQVTHRADPQTLSNKGFDGFLCLGSARQSMAHKPVHLCPLSFLWTLVPWLP